MHLYPGGRPGCCLTLALLHHQQRGVALIATELLYPVAQRLPHPWYVALDWSLGGVGNKAGNYADSDSLGLISHVTHIQWPLSDQLCFLFLALGLWNLVFLFSNLSLIFLMPFAYFFTESEGFAGSRKVSAGNISQVRSEAELYSRELT